MIRASSLPLLITALFMALAWPVLAKERIELEGTSISGSLELPKSDAEVPWAATHSSKQKTGSNIMFKGYVLGEKYTPINRNVFERKIRQYEADDYN